jgi:hypothetical protein
MNRFIYFEYFRISGFILGKRALKEFNSYESENISVVLLKFNKFIRLSDTHINKSDYQKKESYSNQNHNLRLYAQNSD